LNGIIADGENNLADFSTVDLPTGLPSNTFTVNLNAPRTIGSLSFGDTNTASAAAWTLGNGGATNILTLRTTTGVAPTINVNPLASTTTRVNISTVMTGTQGFTKTGGGALMLSAANTFTAGSVVTVNDGSLTFNNNSALGQAALTINGGAINSNVSTLVLANNPAQNWNGEFSFQGTQNLGSGYGSSDLERESERGGECEYSHGGRWNHGGEPG
jgi:autotransporter-associated beta strand protein